MRFGFRGFHCPFPACTPPGARPPAAFVLAVVALATVGCGEKPLARVEVQPAEGKILWKGQPLAGAMVILYPEGEPNPSVRAPRAQTGPDGTFRVGTYDLSDGAPEGQYVVTVVHAPMVKRGGDVVPGPNLLPKKYASPKTSDLRVQVVKGTNELPALALK